MKSGKKEGNLVITIGRETGSDGHRIGDLLAERMGIKSYDKELLSLAAKESGLTPELFETHDERYNNSFIFSLVMDSYNMGYAANPSLTNLPLNHQIFLAQFDAIRKLAERESCVIIGRCADYALEKHNNLIRIFISGDLEDRVERVARNKSLTPEKAKSFISKNDKQRASYYQYYSGKKWADSRSYDFCINSSLLGTEKTVSYILNLLDYYA